MDFFLFLWGFVVSRYKVSFSLRVPPRAFINQLVTGRARERRGRISHVVTASDPGCSLSQACCPWSLDNHRDTSPPGDCFHYSQNFRARGRLSGSHSAPLINTHPQEETEEKGGWPSLWDTKPRKWNEKKSNFDLLTWAPEYLCILWNVQSLTLSDGIWMFLSVQ